MEATKKTLGIWAGCLLASVFLGCGGLTLPAGSQLVSADGSQSIDGSGSGSDAGGGTAPNGNALAGAIEDPASTGTDPNADGTDTSHISCTAGLATGRLVKCDSQQHLEYVADPTTGAYLSDYSTAGYQGGGVLLPVLPVVKTLAPSGGDDTTAIQSALDAVAARPLDANGWRGRVLLGPGTFSVSKTLSIRQSGVVLEGTSSVGPQATTLKLTGSPTTLMEVGNDNVPSNTGTALPITGLPAPAGSRTLTLQSTTGLQVGSNVTVISPRNLAWITMMWGGSYPPVRDGASQTAWGTSMTVRMARTLTKISGNVVTLDAPLGDTVPANSYATPQAAVVQVEKAPGWVSEFGLGHIRLQGRFISGLVSTALLIGVDVNGVQNSWVDDVVFTDFGFTALSLGANTRNITAQDLTIVRSGIQDGSPKPFDINLYGQKLLVQGCLSNGNKTFYATHNTSSCIGPNVVQNYRVQGEGTFEPHQRWAPGILFDNLYVPAGGIALIDRGTDGSGHGWGTGFSAVYNSLAGTTNTTDKAGMDASPGLTINPPPSSANFGMGLVGGNHGSSSAALYDSPAKPIGPPSLWAHQLWQQRGPVALQTVVGPWHITTADGKSCLAASSAQAGATLNAVDCDAAGQLALFDITSRNSVRLGGAGLCIDAAAAQAGAALTLQACRDDDLQHWNTPSRGGFATNLELKAAPLAAPLCLTPGSKQASVGACLNALGPWRLLVTHLARN